MAQFNFNYDSLIDFDQSNFLYFSMNENYTKALRRLRRKTYKHYSDENIKNCCLKMFYFKKGIKPDRVETIITNRVLKDKIFAAVNIADGKKLYPVSAEFEKINSHWKLISFRFEN
ncbi:MAG: hypothetical protein LBB10_01120 [Bifidobacteriaceae bacterium]|jgi:hypothetical protein|nr:hypothetical protein [Bifidobacteriaceae bacterium]